MDVGIYSTLTDLSITVFANAWVSVPVKFFFLRFSMFGACEAHDRLIRNSAGPIH